MKKAVMMIMVALLAGLVGAEIVYQDDFSGSAASLLNGTVPDVRPGSEIWTGPGDDIMADGSFSGASHRTAALPFTMESGRIYTMSVDVVMNSVESDNVTFAAITLADSLGSTNNNPASTGCISYLILRRNGAVRANCSGASAYDTAEGLYSGTVQLTMVIDTTSERWTYDYRINGDSFFTSSTSGHSLGLKYLRIGTYAGFGAASFDNLSLEVEVPVQRGNIYADDLAGSASSYLNGTAPDVRPGSEVWVGPPDDIRSDGYFIGAPARTAVLQFTLETNNVYTLSIDLLMGGITDGDINFAAIALGDTNPAVTNSHPVYSGVFSYLFVRREGSARARCYGGAEYETAAGLYGGKVQLTMVIDTTGEEWTYDYQVNGSSILTTSTTTHTTGEKYIRIGFYSGFGAAVFRNLSVSDGSSNVSHYASWLEGYPGVGSETGMTDDPDGDGLNNLCEWALGGNPDDAGDAGHSPVFQRTEAAGTNWLQYVYAKRNDADALGLIYRLEQNTSLSTASAWTNGNVEVTGTGALDSEFDAITNRISTDTESVQFLRLRVESN